MIRSLMLGFVLSATIALADNNTSLLSKVTCDFAARGQGGALLVQQDGNVIVSGDFTKLNGRPVSSLARLTQAGELDTNFVVQLDYWVDDVVEDGNYIYLAGAFEEVNGVERIGIARVSIADGSLDETWDADTDAYEVYTLALDDNHVYFSGEFDNVGGQPVSHLARVDKETGAVDATFLPNINDSVNAVALSGSNVYVGGEFDKINGIEVNHLACLDKATGAVDTNWNASASNDVWDMAVDGNCLYVGCDGSWRIATPQDYYGLLRFDLTTGNLDTNWNPRVYGTVWTLVTDDKHVYVAGDFTRIAGVPISNLARIDKNTGAPDLTWQPGVLYPDYVDYMGLSPQGLYVSGYLRRIGAASVAGIARLDMTTALVDNGFNVFCETEQTVIECAVMQPDGGLIIGGEFYKAGNVFRDNLVRIMPDGTVDPLWAPNPNDPVTSLAVDQDAVYVGGEFSEIGGASRSILAKLVGENGNADPAWRAPLRGSENTRAVSGKFAPAKNRDRGSPSLRLNDIAVDDTGVYACGYIIMNNGEYSLIKLSKQTGELDSHFLPEPESAYLYTLALQGNRLYVGGYFDWIGGELQPYLACLDATTGAANPDWAPEPDNVIFFLDIHNNMLYVEGMFNDIGGVTNAYGLARLDLATGQADPDWLPLADRGAHQRAASGSRKAFWPWIYGMAFTDTHAILAGDFNGIGAATNAHCLARVSLEDGAADPLWTPQPDSECVKAVVDGQALYVMGFFQEMCGKPRAGFAKLFLDKSGAPAPVEATRNNPDQVTVSWPVCPGADEFEVWRGTEDNLTNAALIADAVEGTTYNDTEVAVGERNYYWVRGINGLGEGGFSEPDRGWRRSLAALCGAIGDYDGDGASDIAVFDQALANWYVCALIPEVRLLAWELAWGAGGFETVVGDYDGDRVSDLAVYDAAGGLWYVWSPAKEEVIVFGQEWGGAGLAPVPGDYDGDGASDLAVYDAAGGLWYIWSPAKEEVIAFGQEWGGEGLTPVPGDYDGDGASDLAVYDAAGGKWYVWSPAKEEVIAFGQEWGGEGLAPVPGDYDGDGTSDLAVHDAAGGLWYVWSLAEEEVIAFGQEWGGAGLAPVPGDFDGDGASDWAVYNTATGEWYIRSSDKTGRLLAWELPMGGTGFVPAAR